MHPTTDELFYPDDRIDSETTGFAEDGDEHDSDFLLDILRYEYVDSRLDPELLAEHCVAVDREYDARLKAKEGEPGFSDNEGVTDYGHEETIMNAVDEWIDSNVDVEDLADYVDMDEMDLHRYLHEKILKKVRPIDQEMWATGKHPDEIEMDVIFK